MNSAQLNETTFISCIAVVSVMLTLMVPSACLRMLPVYDVRTDEKFAFSEDFLRLVLLQQSRTGEHELLVYAMDPIDKEGYIINEDGQLVPFKIYKKGMCFLHPRNCRGGFHKRIPGEPSSQSSDDLYDLQVLKRADKHEDDPNADTLYQNDDDIFDPEYDYNAETKKSEKLVHDIEILNSLLFDLPRNYKMKDPHKTLSSNKDRTLAAYHKEGSASESMKNDKSRNQILKSNYDYLKSTKESPRKLPVQTNAGTLYDLWTDFLNDYNDPEESKADVDTFNPNDDLDIYDYGGHR